LPQEKLGVTPHERLSEDEHAKNNLPDILMRWEKRDGNEVKQPRTAQSFCVPKIEIAATGSYDLSLNRYKEVENDAQEHASPAAILRELRTLEEDISDGLSKLEEMLG
jgi:type I restriction enzyme M protein